MKNKLVLTVIVLITCIMHNTNAQIPTWLWAKDAFGNNHVEGISTASDGIGNVYVIGNFKYSPINFDNVQMTGNGDIDWFLVKYDPNGNFLWAKTIGGILSDKAFGLNTDNSGNVFVTGHYSTTIVLGIDTLINSGGGSFDMFIVKYDPNGNVLWAKSSSSLSGGGAAGKSVIADGNGNIYVTGEYHFYGVIFDMDTLPITLGYDLFVVKYDSNGNVLWANSANASGDEKPTGIALDDFNDIYISGNYYNSNLIFGIDTLIHASPINTDNRFVLKFDNTGNKVWARSVVAPFGGGVCTNIIKDNNGDILVSGSSVIKYDINGNIVWTTAGGASLHSESIAIDSDNNVYIAGSFNSIQIIFGSDTIGSSAGSYDAFLAKYDFNGNPLQVTRMGGNNTDGAKSITIDTFDNVIVTGSYKSMGFYPLGLNKPPYSGANCPLIPAQIGRPINYIMK